MSKIIRKSFWEDVRYDLMWDAPWVFYVIMVMFVPFVAIILTFIETRLVLFISSISGTTKMVETHGLGKLILVFVAIEVVCVVLLAPRFIRVFLENLKRGKE
jgi:hypothetical protein